MKLYYASQIDTRPSTVRDFGSISLSWNGVEYVGSIPIGTLPPAGPPVTPNNIIYLASVKDGANYTVTSKLYYRTRVMAFGQGFVPIIEHYPGDTFPVPPRLLAVDCGESNLDAGRRSGDGVFGFDGDSLKSPVRLRLFSETADGFSTPSPCRR